MFVRLDIKAFANEVLADHFKKVSYDTIFANMQLRIAPIPATLLSNWPTVSICFSQNPIERLAILSFDYLLSDFHPISISPGSFRRQVTDNLFDSVRLN